MENLKVLIIDDTLHSRDSLNLENISTVKFSHKNREFFQISSFDHFLEYYEKMGKNNLPLPDVIIIDRDFSNDVSAHPLYHSSQYDSRGLLYGSQILSRLLSLRGDNPVSFFLYSGDMNGFDNDGLGRTLLDTLMIQQRLITGNSTIEESPNYCRNLLDAIGFGIQRYRNTLRSLHQAGSLGIDFIMSQDKGSGPCSGENIKVFKSILVYTKNGMRSFRLESLFFDVFIELNSTEAYKICQEWCSDIQSKDTFLNNYKNALKIIDNNSGSLKDVVIDRGLKIYSLGISLILISVELLCKQKIEGTDLVSNRLKSPQVLDYLGIQGNEANRSLRKALNHKTITLAKLVNFLTESKSWDFEINLKKMAIRYLYDKDISQEFWPDCLDT